VRLPSGPAHGSHGFGDPGIDPEVAGDARGSGLDEPSDLGCVPCLPPNACSPIYHFEPDEDGGLLGSEHKSLLSRLRLRIRVATPAGRWSPPFALTEATNYHCFTDHAAVDATAARRTSPRRAASSGAQMSDATSPLVLRVSIRELAPTIFICVEDASETPPCCLRNETQHTVWFGLVLPTTSTAFAESIAKPKASFSSHRTKAAGDRLVWHALPPAVEVPLLWDFHKMAASGRKPERSLSVLVATSDPEAAARPAAATVAQFSFGELYTVKAMRRDAGSGTGPSKSLDP